MPVIKVWCLPKMKESKLKELHQSIVRTLVDIEELGIKNEKDITCLFPLDLMRYGLGTDIIIEITGLYEKPNRDDIYRHLLAKSIGKVVQSFFPNADQVECFVNSFNPNQGFWSSR